MEPEIERVLAAVGDWARRRPDIRGLALVGSQARGNARGESDVDLVLLTDRPVAYLEQDDWTTQLGRVEIVRTRRWGALTERRLRLCSGRELDVGIAPASWAATEPVDSGTRQVVLGGLRVLHDPDRCLARLLAACAE